MATRTALFSGAHGLGLPTIAQPRKPLLVKTEDWSSPPLAPRLRRVPLKGNPSLTRSKEGTSAARRAARAPYRTVTHAVTSLTALWITFALNLFTLSRAELPQE